MIPLLFLLAAAAPPGQTATEQRYDGCVALIHSDPAAGVERATRWQKAGGGWAASQCLGLGHVARAEWAPAEAAFAGGARTAEAAGGPAVNLWVQAGNAALAGGDAGQARIDLDRALALNGLPDAMKGEARMDRARAGVALGDLPAARADLDQALALVPQDPMGWLLSATLARRSEDLTRAGGDIAEAEKRAPDDPAIALEHGNIAMLAGHADEARAAWQRALATDPHGDAGKAAQAALDQLAAGAEPPAPQPAPDRPR